MIKNDTDRLMVLTDNWSFGGYNGFNYGYGSPPQMLIEPGESSFFYSDEWSSLTLRPFLHTDQFRPGDLLPFGDDPQLLLEQGQSWFGMEVGDQDVPFKVWERRHWEFTTNGFDHKMYMLTVTDALLDQLAPPPTPAE